jgi:hypothetical protein
MKKVKTCLIPTCTNKSDAGTFVGNLCRPCYLSITDKLHGNSTVERLLKTLEEQHRMEIKEFWKLMRIYLKIKK